MPLQVNNEYFEEEEQIKTEKDDISDEEEERYDDDEEDIISDDEENQLIAPAVVESDQSQKCASSKFDEKSANCYLCPISSCTFSLSQDDENLRIQHFNENHPDIDSQICFLKL